MSELGAGSEDPLVVTIEDVKPVVACRGCLATEQALWLIDHKLADAYSLLISKTHDSDIYPKYICSYCRTLLIKFNKFRNKCLFTQTTLANIHSIGIPITLDLIKSCSIVSSYPLKLTETLLISIDIDDVKSSYLTQNCEESFAAPDLIVQNELKNQTNYSDIKKEAKIEVEIIPPTETILVTDYNNESVSENASTSFDYHQAQDVFDVELQCSDNTHDKYHNPKLNSHENSDIDDDEPCISPQNNDEPCIAPQNNDEPCIALQNNDESSIAPQNSDEIYKVLGKTLTQKQKLYNEKRLKKRAEFEKKFNVRIVKISQEKQIQQIIERKDTDKYKKAPYKCELCYSGFILSVTYKNHMAKHKPVEGYYKCDICKFYCQSLTQLSQHTQRHTNDYICNICGHVSKTNGDARIHGGVHNGVVYDCKTCGKSFSKPSSLTSHIVLRHKGDVPCLICNNLFQGEVGLNQHMKTTHKEAIGAVCASCGVQFHSVSAMQRHRPQGDCDHTHRPCTACGMGFTTDSLLEQHKSRCKNRKPYSAALVSTTEGLTYQFHKRNRHNVQNVRRDSPSRQHRPRTRTAGPSDDADSKKNILKRMCEFCGKILTPSNWETHRRRYHSTGGTLFNCDHCGKGYYYKNALEDHMYKHMGIKTKQYPCKYCRKLFAAYCSRWRHEKLVHENPLSFSCDICNKKLSSKETLQAHVMHTHKGVPWPKRIRNRPRQ